MSLENNDFMENKEELQENLPCEEVPEAVQPERKKKSPWLAVVLAAVAVVAIAAVVIFVLRGRDETYQGEFVEATTQAAHHVNAYGYNSHSIHFSKNDDGTYTYDYLDEKGQSQTLTQEEVDRLLDLEVASCAGEKLTNRQTIYYYNEQYYSFYQNYGSYMSMLMDPYAALDEQLSMDGINTWEQSFVSDGLGMYHQMVAAAARAEAEGFQPETSIDEQAADMLQQMEAVAAQYGFASAQEYVESYFGPGMTVEDYVAFYKLNMYAAAYINQTQQDMEVTHEEASKYYDDNIEYLQSNYNLVKDDTKMVNVRHILITPEETTDEEGNTTITDEAWIAAEATANLVYELWLEGETTEDTFAELAVSYSKDPGSQAGGGLYEGVYPDQMVAEFNDWCFAEGREVGDHGIVKTSYGYHIMFFSGHSDQTYWRTVVDTMVRSEKINVWLKELEEAYPMTSDVTKVVLLSAMAPTVPAVEEETPAEGETAEPAQETETTEGE